MITETEVYYVKVAKEGGQFIAFFAEQSVWSGGAVHFHNCQVLVGLGNEIVVSCLATQSFKENDPSQVIFATPHPQPSWFRRFGDGCQEVQKHVLYQTA